MKVHLPEAFFTYFSAVAVNLFSYGGGLAYGWSSPALPKLSGVADPNNNPLPYPANLSEESWIASLLSLGAMLGPLLAHYCSEKFGRKKTLLAFSLPMIIGNIIIIFADRVMHFYVARFLIGISVGCIFATIPVYSAEISQDHNRGVLGAMLLLFVSSGHFTSSVVLPYVTIKTFSIISLLPCLLFLVIFGGFVPESPYFYVLADRLEDARMSLKSLRRKKDVEDEFIGVVKSVEELKHSQQNSLKDLFTVKMSLKCFGLGLALMLLQQFTGLIFIVDYTQKIFDTAGTPLKGDVSVMLVTAVQLVSITVSTNLIDKVDRKILLTVSLGILLVLHVSLGTFFYLEWAESLLPVFGLMMFIVAFQLGIGPISYIFPPEILEPHVKSLGTTLIISLGLLGEFGIATLFPLIADRWGFWVPFGVFATNSILALLFVWKCIPETRGKSFLEIQTKVRSD